MKNRSENSSKRYIVLVISTTTAFIMPFMIAALNVAIPTIREEFSMGAWVSAWVGTIYFLSVAIVQVPFGRLADIYGRKKFFILGLLIIILASLFGIFTTTVPLLFISLALMGFGSGITYNNSISILTSSFPADQRGRVLGINTAGTYLGLSVGPYFGGVITTAFGWQGIFILSAVMSGVVLLLVFYALKGEWRGAAGERFDLGGAITYGISIALLIYGLSSLPDTLGAIIFAVGIIGIVFFTRWEARADSPIFDLSLFKTNRVFSFSNLAVFMSYIATYAVTFLLSFYLQDIKGLTPDGAGLVLVTASVLMAVFAIISGRISDRVEPRLVASVGMSLNIVALLLLVFINAATPIWYIVMALTINGLGIGFFSSPNTNAIIGSVEKKSLGLAAGTLGTMRTVGMMVSMSIIMILFSVYIGQAEIVPEFHPQFLQSARTGFITLTVASVLGLIFQLSARKPKPV